MNQQAAANMTPDSKERLRSRPKTASLILIGGLAALVLSMGLSISFGAANIRLSEVWSAVFNFHADVVNHQIIRDLRLPRVLASAMIGASFAVAGALMQGMTRNPLADSGLLGINAGAGFALALCFAFFPGLSFMYLILYAFLGAGVGAGLVYGVGSLAPGGLTPVRLVLAGTKWVQLKIMFPWIAGALIGSLLISRSITMLSLGDEVAKGLGQRTALIKLAAVLIVLVLAGSSVAVVGSVGFIGLIIPHVTRYLVGVDYRWIVPCSAVLGSLLA
ncbi:hypothetical protein BGX30_002876, partial [Mortierella sp. GBA39]